MATFEETLDTLAAHRRLKRSQTRQLSDLNADQIRQLKAVWSGLPDRERINLVATLKRQAEEDALVDFDSVYRMAMDDANPDVRRLAIGASLDNESQELLSKLLGLCADDPEEMVRSAAAERLAGFAYEAEVGTLSERDAERIERVLLEKVRSETEAMSVRASALASAGYFSTEEVRTEVRRALSRDGLRLAAIRAIGRNCDPVWTPVLEEQMSSDDPAVRREAAEAAADYEGTVDALADLVDDPDTSVRMAAISSLGKIGGDEALDTLVYCYESSDPATREAAAAALEEMEEEEDLLGLDGGTGRWDSEDEAQ